MMTTMVTVQTAGETVIAAPFGLGSGLTSNRAVPVCPLNHVPDGSEWLGASSAAYGI